MRTNIKFRHKKWDAFLHPYCITATTEELSCLKSYRTMKSKTHYA
jgi:hypothetical protein